MAMLFTAAIRRSGAPMRRMSTAASASTLQVAPTPLITSGRAIGVVLGMYVGALGSRIIQARKGTLPDDLDGPLATLTAAKAIKKFCSPAPPAAPAAATAEHSHDGNNATAVEPVALLEGEPPAGSPEALAIIASLQNIHDRLGRVQQETTR